ncbi:hypothetical protein HW555_002152, partial [Spodoptera exigua]
MEILRNLYDGAIDVSATTPQTHQSLTTVTIQERKTRTRSALAQLCPSLRHGRGQNHSDNTSCKNFVISALRYHNNCKTKNGDVCLMGKYHNLLYVAMKLAFDWSLQDNGAIFGTSAPYFLAGWKSDFMDKEENVHALVFFLDHATNANLEYEDNGKTYRFIDVPLESCGHASPVRVVIQMGASEMLMILLRFGARITSDVVSTNPIESILDRLNEYNRKYPYELVSCLKLAMRAVPSISLSVDKNVLKHLELPEDYNYQRKLMLEKYGDILADHLVPASRCGLKPVELKHLSRCKIRQILWSNFELPFGIQKLPVPMSLKRYLDFIFANVDGTRYTSGLAAAGQVDGVPEEAVPRHAVTNHTSHYFSGVDTDGCKPNKPDGVLVKEDRVQFSEGLLQLISKHLQILRQLVVCLKLFGHEDQVPSSIMK